MPLVRNTTAGPVQGYRALTASSATKTSTPIEQIPQNISVVPRSVIDSQVSTSVSEAVQNVSNVQPMNSLTVANTEPNGPLKIRGFAADQWRDGFANMYNNGDRDGLVNVERIEVLKGPNAILYGSGGGAPLGGAVNVISKMPTDKAKSEFGVMFGSFQYWNPYFDINQPLNPEKTMLFRITGEYTGNKSYIDVLDSKRYNINPTLTLTNRSDTSLTIQAFLSKQQQQAYQGLPVYGTLLGNFRVNRDLFIGPSDIPQSYSKTQGVTVTFDHQFNANVSANIKARWSQSEFDQFSQPIFGDFADGTGATPLLPPSTWYLTNLEMFQQQREFAINPNLQVKFDAGPTRNTLLFGADYSRIKDNGYMTQDLLFNSCLGPCLVDLQNPSFPFPYSKPNPAAGTDFLEYFNFQNTYITQGIYTQLQSTIFERIHVTGGARIAKLDMTYNEFVPAIAGTYTTDETKLLPRVGVVVDLLPGISPFASYSEGMKWVPFSSSVSQPLPEMSKQVEAGIKFNFNNELTGTLAVFDIQRDNVPVLVAPGQSTLSAQRSRGFEVDVIYQPNKNWSFLGSFAYTDATYSDPFLFNGQIVLPGNKLLAVPERSGRFWANYTFDRSVLPGWSVGAGVYAASSQFVDPLNLWETDGYYTVDAKIAYENDRIKAAITAKNLTGQEYYTPYSWLGGQVAPSAPRAIYGQVAFKFN